MMKNWLKISQFFVNLILSDDKYILNDEEMIRCTKAKGVKIIG